MTLLASPSRERRKHALMPNGEPRYVHCYDNGVTKKPTFDRYTIVCVTRHVLTTVLRGVKE